MLGGVLEQGTLVSDAEDDEVVLPRFPLMLGAMPGCSNLERR
jgi:hypothetical protein